MHALLLQYAYRNGCLTELVSFFTLYVCARGIDFVSFYDFLLDFRTFPTILHFATVVLFFFISIYMLNKHLYPLIIHNGVTCSAV